MAPTPCCSLMIRLTSLAAFSVTLIAMCRFLSLLESKTRSPFGLRLSQIPNSYGRGLRLCRLLLVLIILDRRLDGILGQDRTVYLDRRQGQLFHDRGVADLHRLVDRLALEPFGRQAARSDG